MSIINKSKAPSSRLVTEQARDIDMEQRKKSKKILSKILSASKLVHSTKEVDRRESDFSFSPERQGNQKQYTEKFKRALKSQLGGLSILEETKAKKSIRNKNRFSVIQKTQKAFDDFEKRKRK